ncbi:aminotransferase class V-fold PLP-dependent enzyme [Alphaproteobacteria bacterium]|jgi:alanine-glyoxylate transaminase/serine-glyoxylate transaminase/serine-pyruvate transaminase|nr:aminotransferase class V-fold PLP-dependent enzyme [Alphaproteobacteria bacterium]MDA9013034.1 aminotransferase class V-fold PLP-dependent enzyme [Alphaproteobacteria bacterium]MDA9131944.1 aminotransferase class V-fold PLP-dependent enzyme [Alphaproteobacteria bacterium]MDB0013840.1 aminotransferase class V-fold PLP-dependent enzyme [Alphaproteobacteria bacterium]MDB4147528.1 aminotransferase class V-fold PLP-dependent enzyme [Alphaproteobacteria bacterium]
MPTPYAAGRHFLQIPGPTNVPDRVLRAMDYPTIDHRGPQFAEIGAKCLAGMKTIFKTDSHAVIYPASGTGAWESALVNTLQEGDLVLMVETGHFASLWHKMASRLGLETEFLATDWRRGVDPQQVEDRLRADTENKIKAVCIVHNETSTGSTSRVNEVRVAMNNAGHDALLLADTISSLGSIDFRHDEWGVDVTVAGSQKGLMLPPGLSFNAVSEKALAVASKGGMRRSYWDWEEQIAANKDGAFPFTPATNLLYGLAEAIDMLHEEGLDNVFKRHDRHAAATRKAVQAWGLEVLCQEPKDYSSALTAVLLPDGHDADAFRAGVLQNFNMSLGNGLAKLAGKVFRIGHLGDFNDLMLLGTLSGVEMGLSLANIPHQKGGVDAAMNMLKGD